jgi:hypothetical protein
MISEYDDSTLSPAVSPGKKPVLWLPVLPGQSQKIPMIKWGAILRNIDFCFCPPGYEQKSHRVIECLLQGAIPIVHCPQDYDIDLQDGVNSIIVRHGDWQTAVARAMDCDLADIVRMRHGISKLVAAHLTHRAAAQRWLHFMGIGAKLSLASLDESAAAPVSNAG